MPSKTESKSASSLSPKTATANSASANAASKDPGLLVSVRKRFPGAERDFSLDVEFDAAPGFTILFGPSGSGKTTVLDCVAGFTTPEAGRISLGERILFDSHAHTDVSVAQRGIGYVLQDLALFPHLKVHQNVEYGLARLARAVRRERSTAMLQNFRIDHLRSQFPAKISGGERQRVALARSLVTNPCVLLLDEPLAALDVSTKARIIDDLRRWNQVHRIPILYVTHSREEVMALGERVLVMDHGRIIAQGTPHEVLRAPLQETVAQLAGFENIFDAIVELVNEERGSMMCRLLGDAGSSALLEVPLIRAEAGSGLRVGIRAGDILLATVKPAGLSARNSICGRLIALERRDMIISARVDCGVEMEVYLTLAARDDLQLVAGGEVWLVIKTHSCHLMQK